MNRTTPIAHKTALLFSFLRRERKSVYTIYALAIFQGLLYIAIPLTIQGIITYVMAGRFSASLILLSIATILTLVFIAQLQLWQMRVNETLHEKIFCKLTDRIAAYGIVEMPESLQQRIAHFFEVVTLQKGIGKILLEFSFSVISIVIGLLILPAYSNWFLLFAVLLGFGFYMIVTYYGKRAMNAHLETSGEKYKLFDELRAGRYHEGNVSALNDILDKYLFSRKKYYETFERQYKGIIFFKIFFVTVLLIVGAYLVQIGELNIGQFITSEIIILLVINSVEKLVGSLGTCYDVITSIYKIENIFKTHPEKSYLHSAEPEVLNYQEKIYRHPYEKRIRFVVISIFVSGIVLLFMPWTQSVDMQGEVSVLNPGNKPQKITSRIAGRIEKWFISDGQFVHKNDTIAYISEIKEEYLDTGLVMRSESQVKSKETAMQSYGSKVEVIDQQIDALNRNLLLKSGQIRNKIVQTRARLSSDSAEAIAARAGYKVAEEQFRRYEDLYKNGIISKTDLETRRMKLQESNSKRISSENKIIETQNELLNNEIELNTIKQDYQEKLMKAEAEKFEAMSRFYDAEGSLTKLQNQLSNYALRNQYYYVLAPQDGYINQIKLSGVGEVLKEGDEICQIVPVGKEQVVELFVEPMDLPLMRKGQNVRLIFDGYPSFVFSGWPGLSYGTFGAEIVSFDRTISPNGKFRVLAVNRGEPWPESIQIGGGVKGFALLRNVPLIYEFWRKANGFPPEFYHPKESNKPSKKK